MWKTLIVDDDIPTARQLAGGLKTKIRSTVVHNGDEALFVYQEALRNGFPFDFVILDVTMPGGNGFEVLKAIRTLEDEHNVPRASQVIMITSYRDSLMTYYNMGWDDFITKPVDAKLLLEHMRRLKEKSKE